MMDDLQRCIASFLTGVKQTFTVGPLAIAGHKKCHLL